MILKQEDFKYPTEDERRTVYLKMPKLDDFKFSNTSVRRLLLIDKEPMSFSSRINNLCNWNICLVNRFGKLRQTYTYMATHFDRGIVDDISITNSKDIVINTFQFDYYAEIFYYYLFSCLDIIAHILNEYFRLEIANENVAFNYRLIKEIEALKDVLIQTNNDFNQSRDIRNSFAHKFTPTQNNYTTIVEKTEQGTIMKFFSGKKYNLDTVYKDALNSMNVLAGLLIQLKNYMEKDTENNTFLFD